MHVFFTIFSRNQEMLVVFRLRHVYCPNSGRNHALFDLFSILCRLCKHGVHFEMKCVFIFVWFELPLAEGFVVASEQREHIKLGGED